MVAGRCQSDWLLQCGRSENDGEENAVLQQRVLFEGIKCDGIDGWMDDQK